MRNIKFKYYFKHEKNNKIITKVFSLVELSSLNLRQWMNIEIPECYFIGKGQYTGIKDKNRKEIYEGDIIKVYKNKKYIVEDIRDIYNTNSETFDAINDLAMFDEVLDEEEEKDEVVGNIYKNPKMLQLTIKNVAMKIRKKFKRKVIELIHGMPYDKACDIETRGLAGKLHKKNIHYKGTITIGRVMKALANGKGEWHITAWGNNVTKIDENIEWKLTKENGQECTDDDQTDKTIEKLYKLIDNN